MAQNRYYSNTAAQLALASPVTNVATTLPVSTTSGLPASYPFSLIVDPDTPSEEIVSVTNVVGLNLTVSRGYDGTVAVSHGAGAVLIHGHIAADFAEAGAHVGATANVHGTGGGNAVMGTGTAQTVTNKDLTSGTNTFPASLATDAGAETFTNKDLTSSTNSFPQQFTPQPGDYKFVSYACAASPTVIGGGWLFCDGGAVSRTTFATLFAKIGTSYGAGNGSTTFNLPDFQGRAPIGAGTWKALAGNEGLAEASRGPFHTHGISSDGAHTHNAGSIAADVGTRGTGGVNTAVNPITGTTGSSGAHSHTGNTGNSSGDPISHLAANVLIKT